MNSLGEALSASDLKELGSILTVAKKLATRYRHLTKKPAPPSQPMTTSGL